jgi:rod shape-determining protein MreC
MSSKKIIIGILLVSILVISQSDKLKSPFLNIFNNTKINVIHLYEYISLSIDKYFYQSSHIEKLSLENKKLRDYIASYEAYINKCKDLSNFNSLNIKNIKFTQTISYAKLPIISQIYINYESNNSKIKGLIYNNQTAGIVTQHHNNFSLALLNSDKETTYTVFINNNIPGVLFGGDKIVIKYIPKYHKININDEVITSGLDNIFYKGVKVGLIKKIRQTDLYQEAEITPYYNPLKPSLFYVVE